MFSRHIRISWLFLLILCMCMFSPFILSVRALAYADPITVTSQTDTVSFPKGIDFQMSAHDSGGNITQATIYVSYAQDGSQDVQPVMAAKPGPTVTFKWHEDTSGNRFAPPGTQINYHWQIQDSTGNTHVEGTQTFTVTDSRFNWQHVTDGQLQVNWYNEPASFGQGVLAQADTSLKRISGNLGSGLLHPINLWIYPVENDFKSSLPPGTYEWVGGIAFPSLGQADIVANSLDNTALIRDMPHELTHMVFHQLTADGIPPRWFDEGLAVYNQLYHEPEMKLRFRQGLDKHELLRLGDIWQNFPADSDKAYLAYAESWNLIDYMYSTYGQKKMATLIQAMDNSTLDFDQDLKRTLGIDQPHLENQWRVQLNQPATLTPEQLTPAPTPVPTPVVINTPVVDTHTPVLVFVGALLILFPLLGIGGLFFYLRRSREKAKTVQQAQSILQSSLPSQAPQYMPYDPTRPYMDQARYTPQPYPGSVGYPGQYPVQAPGMPGAGRPPQLPMTPIHLPADQPDFLSPLPPEREESAKLESESYQSPFMEPVKFQEYSREHPSKQVSQE